MKRHSKHNAKNPATFGGSGFKKRRGDWNSDLGTLWKNWSVLSDSDRLTDVSLAWPEDVYQDIQDPNAELLLERPNIKQLVEQCSNLIKTYEQCGVRVHLLKHPQFTPNWIFQRDTFNSTPMGIVLGRMASEQRKAEIALQAQTLTALQAPIVMSIHNDGIFEGADLLWLNKTTAFIGVGNRTNKEAVTQLQKLFPNVTFHEILLPPTVQHLLGIMNFIGINKVGIWSSLFPSNSLKILKNLDIETIHLCDEDEIRSVRSLNWVCLDHNKILMPDDAPNTKKILLKHDVKIVTAHISAYRQCGGGLGCLTGILARDSIQSLDE